jgi:hypothetical protein
MVSKRTRFMTADAWAKDLQRTQVAYNSKGDHNWLKILGFAAIGIAATGLVTWGIASAIYGGRYHDKVDKLQAQYDAVKADLEAKYQAFVQRLTNEELKYLGDNGYALMTCASYEMPDSILCNGYHYQLMQGTKYCTVQCYKNVATGKETLHQAPVCSSPFIPADCYDPSEYWRGHQAGYNDGYDPGYNAGYNDGWDDGDYDGYNDGYDDGESEGYDDGYSDGYSAGVAAKKASETDDDSGNGFRLKLLKSDERASDRPGTDVPASSIERARKAGYADGYHDAMILTQI